VLMSLAILVLRIETSQQTLEAIAPELVPNEAAAAGLDAVVNRSTQA
jgi:MFS transporter, putative metabolite:H+ symporter